MILIKTFI